MKRKYIIVGSLSFLHLFGKAQNAKNTTPERINKTEIEMVYNQYIQDGNNSAITGGIGTEKLTVYGPMVNVKRSFGKNSLDFNFGTDIVSSASVDKIDFVSSVSAVDRRFYADVGYGRKIEKQNLDFYGKIGLSFESDYLSIGSKIGISKQNRKKSQIYSAQFQMFNDDLRWGRRLGMWSDLRLIYPRELRYKEWYDEYKRNTYSLKLGFTQIINKRNTLGLFFDFTYQKGLLATPFHRIYFSDNTKGVEKLPNQRFRSALAIKLNTFVGRILILKNTVNLYSDNFGILAFSIENETAVKLSPFFKLLPNARFYIQSASPYFNKYGMHDSQNDFYTSDYDYSDIRTFNVGIGIRYNPYRYIGERIKFNILTFRYSFMFRSDNLRAHIFSTSFNIEFKNKKRHM